MEAPSLLLLVTAKLFLSYLGPSLRHLEKHFEFHALHCFLRVGGPEKLNYPTMQANKNPGILGQTQKYLGA